MSKPKVSIVVPSYNRAEFLPALFNSILKQTFDDFELIFVDDGSTDDTEKVVGHFAKNDLRIKYFKQVNSERAVARTYGTSIALGDYVCLVDSDDTWREDKLEKQVAVMDSQPDLVCSYASVDRIDDDGKPVKAATRQHQGHSGYIFFDLLKRNFIPSVTPMIRKQYIAQIGEQVTEFIPYEDWDWWLRLSRLGKFYHIREPLGDYRVHQGQSVKNVDAAKIEHVTLGVLQANTDINKINLDHYINMLELKDFSSRDYYHIVNQAYSLAFLRFAYWYIVSGETKEAWDRLIKSAKLSESRLWDYRWYGLWVASFLYKFFPEQVVELLGGFH